MSAGGWYMVSLKHVNSSFSSSVRCVSNVGFRGGEWAKPTPASQMYSQLSIADSSSALSYQQHLTAIVPVVQIHRPLSPGLAVKTKRNLSIQDPQIYTVKSSKSALVVKQKLMTINSISQKKRKNNYFHVQIQSNIETAVAVYQFYGTYQFLQQQPQKSVSLPLQQIVLFHKILNFDKFLVILLLEIYNGRQQLIFHTFLFADCFRKHTFRIKVIILQIPVSVRIVRSGGVTPCGTSFFTGLMLLNKTCVMGLFLFKGTVCVVSFTGLSRGFLMGLVVDISSSVNLFDSSDSDLVRLRLMSPSLDGKPRKPSFISFDSSEFLSVLSPASLNRFLRGKNSLSENCLVIDAVFFGDGDSFSLSNCSMLTTNFAMSLRLLPISGPTDFERCLKVNFDFSLLSSLISLMVASKAQRTQKCYSTRGEASLRGRSNIRESIRRRRRHWLNFWDVKREEKGYKKLYIT
ncbi:hypothetical protein NQ317_008679 [Molorchus minor]|uniref:Uncharacterized protein n=1 Tax=Molorchus minor TaxID=1323400 RepID=A0ABQ9K399_9CUCU|nr:hypothetical protein NQ317_008679 [Molorchus minor]